MKAWNAIFQVFTLVDKFEYIFKLMNAKPILGAICFNTYNNHITLFFP